MLALIDRFKRRGIIPSEVPVYTAGSMRAIADLYDKTRFSTPRLDPDFQVFGVPQKRLPRSRQALRQALSEPSIYVVGSGMMFERTISNEIARMIVENEKDAIFLVGYTREDAPAGRLLEAAAQGKGTEVVLDKGQGAPAGPLRRRRASASAATAIAATCSGLAGRLQPRRRWCSSTARTAPGRWMADNLRFFYPEIDVIVPGLGDVIRL
ncbi:MAG: hypothetical protein KatS3mg043_2209 [Rhodothermaceae bacterium]|nr:MAG: hypothetical protein KatS3mg043_2209 [Rhodothermaceae bacterium]